MVTISRQPASIFGREREQVRLRELLDQAIAGQGSLVLVSGEAGIGKTTLVNDLARKANADDILVLSGGCYDLTTTPPYGPWAEVVFRSYQSDEGLPQIPGALRDLDAIRGQDELFNLAMSFVRDVARQLDDMSNILIATYLDDEITRLIEDGSVSRQQIASAQSKQQFITLNILYV